MPQVKNAVRQSGGQPGNIYQPHADQLCLVMIMFSFMQMCIMVLICGHLVFISAQYDAHLWSLMLVICIACPLHHKH